MVYCVMLIRFTLMVLGGAIMGEGVVQVVGGAFMGENLNDPVLFLFCGTAILYMMGYFEDDDDDE